MAQERKQNAIEGSPHYTPPNPFFTLQWQLCVTIILSAIIIWIRFKTGISLGYVFGPGVCLK